MSKIVQAINSMVINRKFIKNVIAGTADNEIYFNYRDYKWSIIDHGNGYSVFYYPGDEDIKYIASLEDDEWGSNIAKAVYRSRELGGREVTESFRDLFEIVQSKLIDVEFVLNDIISDMDIEMDL